MSIQITVNGSPVSIRRRKMLLTDVDLWKKNEYNRRRKLRLNQVREQSKDFANRVREQVRNEKNKQLSLFEEEQIHELKKCEARKLLALQQKYQECVEEIGIGHTNAVLEPDPAAVLAEQQQRNDAAALQRGIEASERARKEHEDKVKQRNAELDRQKEVRNIENLRSAMVAALPKSDLTGKSPRSRTKTKPLNEIQNRGNPDVMPFHPYSKSSSRTSKTSRVIPPLSGRIQDNSPLLRDLRNQGLTYRDGGIIPVVPIMEPGGDGDMPIVQDVSNPDVVPAVNVRVTRHDQTSSRRSESQHSKSRSLFELDLRLPLPRDVDDDTASCIVPARVQFYDHSARYHRQYQPQPVVTRIPSSSEILSRHAAHQENAAEQARLAAQAQIIHETQRQKRGQQALAKEKIRKDYKLLLDELSYLTREQRLLNSVQHPGPSTDMHLGDDRLKERQNARQRNMDSVFESVLHRTNLATDGRSVVSSESLTTTTTTHHWQVLAPQLNVGQPEARPSQPQVPPSPESSEGSIVVGRVQQVRLPSPCPAADNARAEASARLYDQVQAQRSAVHDSEDVLEDVSTSLREEQSSDAIMSPTRKCHTDDDLSSGPSCDGIDGKKSAADMHICPRDCKGSGKCNRTQVWVDPHEKRLIEKERKRRKEENHCRHNKKDTVKKGHSSPPCCKCLMSNRRPQDSHSGESCSDLARSSSVLNECECLLSNSDSTASNRPVEAVKIVVSVMEKSGRPSSPKRNVSRSPGSHKKSCSKGPSPGDDDRPGKNNKKRNNNLGNDDSGSTVYNSPPCSLAATVKDAIAKVQNTIATKQQQLDDWRACFGVTPDNQRVDDGLVVEVLSSSRLDIEALAPVSGVPTPCPSVIDMESNSLGDVAQDLKCRIAEIANELDCVKESNKALTAMKNACKDSSGAMPKKQANSPNSKQRRSPPAGQQIIHASSHIVSNINFEPNQSRMSQGSGRRPLQTSPLISAGGYIGVKVADGAGQRRAASTFISSSGPDHSFERVFHGTPHEHLSTVRDMSLESEPEWRLVPPEEYMSDFHISEEEWPEESYGPKYAFNVAYSENYTDGPIDLVNPLMQDVASQEGTFKSIEEEQVERIKNLSQQLGNVRLEQRQLLEALSQSGVSRRASQPGAKKSPRKSGGPISDASFFKLLEDEANDCSSEPVEPQRERPSGAVSDQSFMKILEAARIQEQLDEANDCSSEPVEPQRERPSGAVSDQSFMKILEAARIQEQLDNANDRSSGALESDDVPPAAGNLSAEIRSHIEQRPTGYSRKGKERARRASPKTTKKSSQSRNNCSFLDMLNESAFETSSGPLEELDSCDPGDLVPDVAQAVNNAAINLSAEIRNHLKQRPTGYSRKGNERARTAAPKSTYEPTQSKNNCSFLDMINASDRNSSGPLEDLSEEVNRAAEDLSAELRNRIQRRVQGMAIDRPCSPGSPPGASMWQPQTSPDQISHRQMLNTSYPHLASPPRQRSTSPTKRSTSPSRRSASSKQHSPRTESMFSRVCNTSCDTTLSQDVDQDFDSPHACTPDHPPNVSMTVDAEVSTSYVSPTKTRLEGARTRLTNIFPHAYLSPEIPAHLADPRTRVSPNPRPRWSRPSPQKESPIELEQRFRKWEDSDVECRDAWEALRMGQPRRRQTKCNPRSRSKSPSPRTSSRERRMADNAWALVKSDDDEMPDVMGQMLRCDLITEPLPWSTKPMLLASDTSDGTCASDDYYASLLTNVLPDLDEGTGSSSGSPVEELSTTLNKLGLSWAASTVRKTQAASNLSSSSSPENSRSRRTPPPRTSRCLASDTRPRRSTPRSSAGNSADRSWTASELHSDDMALVPPNVALQRCPDQTK